MIERWFYLAGNPYSVTAQDIGLPTSTTTVGGAMGGIAVFLIGLVGMISVVAIIWGAIQLMYSRGNPKNVQQGRETILYACVGLVLALSAYAVVTFILDNVK